jgi:polyribonucleotide nucleotidyltransferase
VLQWVLSYDFKYSPEPLAITAAGAALALSDVPMKNIVAGVRVGLVDGAFVVNPTVSQMENSTLDLMMAGTKDAVLMIEGFCDFLTEEEMLEVCLSGLFVMYLCVLVM